jgi:hypothetical protein
MIIAFDIMHGNKKHGVLAYVSVIMTFGFVNVLSVFSSLFNPEEIFVNVASPVFIPHLMVNCVGYLIPIILIAMPRKQNEKRPGKFVKWFFYIFYPLHLALLVLYSQLFIMSSAVGMPEML